MDAIKWKKNKRGKFARTVTARQDARTQEEKEEMLPMQIMKALLVSYGTSVILLVGLAFIMYRFQLGQNMIAVGILGIYIVSTFVGGFFVGKCMKVRKFFWGMVVGILYVILLLLITLGVYRTLNNGDILTTLILCTCSGTLGGMLS